MRFKAFVVLTWALVFSAPVFGSSKNGDAFLIAESISGVWERVDRCDGSFSYRLPDGSYESFYVKFEGPWVSPETTWAMTYMEYYDDVAEDWIVFLDAEEGDVPQTFIWNSEEGLQYFRMSIYCTDDDSETDQYHAVTGVYETSRLLPGSFKISLVPGEVRILLEEGVMVDWSAGDKLQIWSIDEDGERTDWGWTLYHLDGSWYASVPTHLVDEDFFYSITIDGVTSTHAFNPTEIAGLLVEPPTESEFAVAFGKGVTEVSFDEQGVGRVSHGEFDSSTTFLGCKDGEEHGQCSERLTSGFLLTAMPEGGSAVFALSEDVPNGVEAHVFWSKDNRLFRAEHEVSVHDNHVHLYFDKDYGDNRMVIFISADPKKLEDENLPVFSLDVYDYGKPPGGKG